MASSSRGDGEGLGLLTYANGDTYDGEWINNLFHGHGVFLPLIL